MSSPSKLQFPVGKPPVPKNWQLENLLFGVGGLTSLSLSKVDLVHPSSWKIKIDFVLVLNSSWKSEKYNFSISKCQCIHTDIFLALVNNLSKTLSIVWLPAWMEAMNLFCLSNTLPLAISVLPKINKLMKNLFFDFRIFLVSFKEGSISPFSCTDHGGVTAVSSRCRTLIFMIVSKMNLQRKCFQINQNRVESMTANRTPHRN